MWQGCADENLLRVVEDREVGDREYGLGHTLLFLFNENYILVHQQCNAFLDLINSYLLNNPYVF